MGQLIEMAAFRRQIAGAEQQSRAEYADAYADAFGALAARHEIPRAIVCAFTWIYQHVPLPDVAEELDRHESPADRPWHIGMGWVRYYQAVHDAVDNARFLKLAWYQKGDCARPMLHLWIEYGRQMATPATNRQQLRWKEEHANFIGGHPNWTAAIERDRAALASRKRKAG